MRTTHQHPDLENIIDADGLQGLKDRVALEVNEGLLPSAQFAVAFEGKMLAYETFGNASNSTLYPIFSATKAITASLAWQAIEAGSLDLAQSVGH
ncbi:MAG: serine hydrolase, partial [Pseudomonadales bacterium]